MQLREIKVRSLSPIVISTKLSMRSSLRYVCSMFEIEFEEAEPPEYRQIERGMFYL